MRCLIDMSGITVGAGVTYACRILPALATLDSRSMYFVLLPNAGDELGLDLPENFRLISLPRLASHSLARVTFLQVWLPLWTRRHKIDVLFSAFDYSAPLVQCPLVLGIHNLSPYAGPRASNHYGRRREQTIRFLARLSARKAKAVLFVSDSARKIISPCLGLDPDKCHVVYYGLSDEFFQNWGAQERNGGEKTVPAVVTSPDPYVLSVSSIAVHKDLETLVRAFGRVIRENAIPHHLVIAGPVLEPRYYQRLQRLAVEQIPPGRVSFLGTVPHGEMPRLYRRSSLTVLASMAETFGMPLAEAMASGVPAIASDIPALREVGGDAVLYYEPGDEEGLARAVSRVLTEPLLRDRLCLIGSARAKNFSWRNAAAETYILLVAAAGKDARQGGIRTC